MKISIVTVCLNSEKTIKTTLNSIASQTYKNIEHICVDGGSKDKTIDIIKKTNKKLIIANGKGIYESINIGIKNCTGKWILILHSNDFLNDSKVIEKMISKLKNDLSIYHGDVVFFKDNYFKDIVRTYKFPNYNASYLKFGLIPPHTGSFISKKVYRLVGLYNPEYKIAGDFDFFLRCFKNFKIKPVYTNMLISRMQTGGISGKNLLSYWVSTKEIYQSIKKNKLLSNIIFIFSRVPIKIKQFILLNKNFYNTKFEYKTLYNNKEQPSYFELIKKIQNFDTRNNFILSALNLAFLGSFCKGEITHSKNFFCWPDGIYSKKFFNNIIKIPGRDLLIKIKLDKKIKRILVLGNLSLIGKEFLIKQYNLPIKNFILPYGDVKIILKSLKNIKIKKNDLIFITLPTPKQEQVAIKLSKSLKNYKIICIGGSIAIASGSEKPVPAYFSNYEYIWRLRYETIRRTKRLLSTFFWYLKGKYLSNDLKKINVDVIE